MNYPAGIEVLDKLITHQLPTLLPGAPDLLKSLSEDDIEIDEMVVVLERFPNIVGRLISLANSAWSAPVSTVTSLEVACSRLGFAVVKSTSIALAVAAPFNPNRCPTFDPEFFWSFALLSAETASWLVPESTSVKDLQPSTARTAGLMHSLGLLWLVDKLPEELNQVFEMMQRDKDLSLRQGLNQVLGFDHAQAGGILGKNWDLPDVLVAAMACYPEKNHQSVHREIVHTVGLAVNLVSAAWRVESGPRDDVRSDFLGISAKNLKEIFDRISQRQAKIQELAKNLFA